MLEFLDDTIKTPEDVSNLTDLPTLAGIAVYEVKGEDKYTVVTQTKPRSPISEAYRTLRTAILFANVDRSTCSILVTSANPSEGKSSTVANLGVVMAQAGHRVLIVDADLRRPVQHIIFKLSSNNYGLTNLLVKMLIDENSEDPAKDTHMLLEGAIHETSQSALYLLTSGSLPPNPAELVGSAKMQSLLEMLSELFDYIIIDGPPNSSGDRPCCTKYSCGQCIVGQPCRVDQKEPIRGSGGAAARGKGQSDRCCIKPRFGENKRIFLLQLLQHILLSE